MIWPQQFGLSQIGWFLCRAIWGWDDEYVFVSNMKRTIDVISTSKKSICHRLSSALMTSIPSRLAAHPNMHGILAGCSAGGQVYIWQQQQPCCILCIFLCSIALKAIKSLVLSFHQVAPTVTLVEHQDAFFVVASALIFSVMEQNCVVHIMHIDIHVISWTIFFVV